VRSIIVLLLAAGFVLGQTPEDSIYVTRDPTAPVVVPGRSYAMVIGRSNGSSVGLRVTVGGGLIILDDKDDSVVAEIRADGTIKGDKARALRMLAAALAEVFPEAAKPEPQKKPKL